jgi:hypothetical protein
MSDSVSKYDLSSSSSSSSSSSPTSDKAALNDEIINQADELMKQNDITRSICVFRGTVLVHCKLTHRRFIVYNHDEKTIRDWSLRQWKQFHLKDTDSSLEEFLNNLQDDCYCLVVRFTDTTSANHPKRSALLASRADQTVMKIIKARNVDAPYDENKVYKFPTHL